MLTFPAMFALIACAAGLFIAALAARLARAAGWRSEASLVPVALTASAYAFCDLATYAQLPVDSEVLGQRLGLTAGALHVVAWLRFSAAHLGLEGLRRRLWWGYAALAGMTLVPGLAHTGEVRRRIVPRLALVYNEAVPSSLGVALTVTIAGGLIVVAARYVQALHRGVRGAGPLVAAFAFYIAVTVNDILAAYGTIDAPALLDGAFFAPLGVAVWLLADRFVAEARDLDQGRGELQRTADLRGREIDEAAAAIARDARLAALGSFSSAVAHAINNPASVAAANLTHVLESARSGAIVPAEHREALVETRDALARIGQITGQLLHASRLAAAPGGDDVDAAVAVQGAVDLARRRGRSPKRLGVSVPSGLRLAVEGPVLVEVLANLLDETSEAIGEVRITAAETGRGRMDLVVADDGPPMDPEVLARALDPFFSIQPGRTSQLGLSMCRALIVGQGGDLSVSSRRDDGTRFVLDLPRSQGTPTPPRVGGTPA